MRHQVFKSTRRLAKLAGGDLIYPSLLCFRYCMTYPGTYSCPPPPLCQHRWYLTAHPWTWCWCFTDTGKAFQSLSFQHKDECFGPELLWKSARWLVSSLHLCSVCDWGNCFENTHTVCSNLLYSKGKMIGPTGIFFLNHVKVILFNNFWETQSSLFTHTDVCEHRVILGQSFSLNMRLPIYWKFPLILKLTATPNLRIVSFHMV